MSQRNQVLFVTALAVVAAAAAAGVMMLFSAETGWLKFVAWSVFFLALQSPTLMFTRDSDRACTAWLARLWKRG
jgi:hypothetical protein